MIFNTHDPLPRPIRERSVYEGGPLCACGGRIEATVPPFVNVTTADGKTAQLSGVTICRCDRCQRVETAAERAAKLAAPHTQCIVCGAAIKPRLVAGGVPKRYCSPKCRVRNQVRIERELAAERRAQEPPRPRTPPPPRVTDRDVIGQTRECAGGCGKSFTITEVRCHVRQYCSRRCKALAHYHRRQRERAA